MMGKTADLFELSAEITAVSLIITGLGNQLDDTATDTLEPQAMQGALFGVARHLGRIAQDLDGIDRRGVEHGKD